MARLNAQVREQLQEVPPSRAFCSKKEHDDTRQGCTTAGQADHSLRSGKPFCNRTAALAWIQDVELAALQTWQDSAEHSSAVDGNNGTSDAGKRQQRPKTIQAEKGQQKRAFTEILNFQNEISDPNKTEKDESSDDEDPSKKVWQKDEEETFTPGQASLLLGAQAVEIASRGRQRWNILKNKTIRSEQSKLATAQLMETIHNVRNLNWSARTSRQVKLLDNIIARFDDGVNTTRYRSLQKELDRAVEDNMQIVTQLIDGDYGQRCVEKKVIRNEVAKQIAQRRILQQEISEEEEQHAQTQVEIDGIEDAARENYDRQRGLVTHADEVLRSSVRRLAAYVMWVLMQTNHFKVTMERRAEAHQRHNTEMLDLVRRISNSKQILEDHEKERLGRRRREQHAVDSIKVQINHVEKNNELNTKRLADARQRYKNLVAKVEALLRTRLSAHVKEMFKHRSARAERLIKFRERAVNRSLQAFQDQIDKLKVELEEKHIEVRKKKSEFQVREKWLQAIEAKLIHCQVMHLMSDTDSEGRLKSSFERQITDDTSKAVVPSGILSTVAHEINFQLRWLQDRGQDIMLCDSSLTLLDSPPLSTPMWFVMRLRKALQEKDLKDRMYHFLTMPMVRKKLQVVQRVSRRLLERVKKRRASGEIDARLEESKRKKTLAIFQSRNDGNFKEHVVGSLGKILNQEVSIYQYDDNDDKASSLLSDNCLRHGIPELHRLGELSESADTLLSEWGTWRTDNAQVTLPILEKLKERLDDLIGDSKTATDLLKISTFGFIDAANLVGTYFELLQNQLIWLPALAEQTARRIGELRAVFQVLSEMPIDRNTLVKCSDALLAELKVCEPLINESVLLVAEEWQLRQVQCLRKRLDNNKITRSALGWWVGQAGLKDNEDRIVQKIGAVKRGLEALRAVMGDNRMRKLGNMTTAEVAGVARIVIADALQQADPECYESAMIALGVLEQPNLADSIRKHDSPADTGEMQKSTHREKHGEDEKDEDDLFDFDLPQRATFSTGMNLRTPTPIRPDSSLGDDLVSLPSRAESADGSTRPPSTRPPTSMAFPAKDIEDETLPEWSILFPVAASRAASRTAARRLILNAVLCHIHKAEPQGTKLDSRFSRTSVHVQKIEDVPPVSKFALMDAFMAVMKSDTEVIENVRRNSGFEQDLYARSLSLHQFELMWTALWMWNGLQAETSMARQYQNSVDNMMLSVIFAQWANVQTLLCARSSLQRVFEISSLKSEHRFRRLAIVAPGDSEDSQIEEDNEGVEEMINNKRSLHDEVPLLDQAISDYKGLMIKTDSISLDDLLDAELPISEELNEDSLKSTTSKRRPSDVLEMTWANSDKVGKMLSERRTSRVHFKGQIKGLQAGRITPMGGRSQAKDMGDFQLGGTGIATSPKKASAGSTASRRPVDSGAKDAAGPLPLIKDRIKKMKSDVSSFEMSSLSFKCPSEASSHVSRQKTDMTAAKESITPKAKESTTSPPTEEVLGPFSFYSPLFVPDNLAALEVRQVERDLDDGYSDDDSEHDRNHKTPWAIDRTCTEVYVVQPPVGSSISLLPQRTMTTLPMCTSTTNSERHKRNILLDELKVCSVDFTLAAKNLNPVEVMANRQLLSKLKMKIAESVAVEAGVDFALSRYIDVAVHAEYPVAHVQITIEPPEWVRIEEVLSKLNSASLYGQLGATIKTVPGFEVPLISSLRIASQRRRDDLKAPRTLKEESHGGHGGQDGMSGTTSAPHKPAWETHRGDRGDAFVKKALMQRSVAAPWVRDLSMSATRSSPNPSHVSGIAPVSKELSSKSAPGNLFTQSREEDEQSSSISSSFRIFDTPNLPAAPTDNAEVSVFSPAHMGTSTAMLMPPKGIAKGLPRTHVSGLGTCTGAGSCTETPGALVLRPQNPLVEQSVAGCPVEKAPIRRARSPWAAIVGETKILQDVAMSGVLLDDDNRDDHTRHRNIGRQKRRTCATPGRQTPL